MAKKIKHGGKRKGAGRKSAFGESTVVVCVRLPVSVVEVLAAKSGTAAAWLKAAAMEAGRVEGNP